MVAGWLGIARFCNHTIGTLYPSIIYGWNKCTKTTIKPKRKKEIVAINKTCLKMGKKFKSGYKSGREKVSRTNNFWSLLEVHRKSTGECTSLLINSHYISNPNVVIFKSVERVAIKTSSNLTVRSIEDNVVMQICIND